MSPQEQIAQFADIILPIEVQLGREIMSLKDVLELEEGGVIRLHRSAGENIDILVGEALVASGEIVVLEDYMGVRITDFNEEI